MKKRLIIHYDLNYFYAQVEIRDRPELKNVPVVLGSRPYQRGIVCTCNYEARNYGIHSGMSSSMAYKKCPHAVFISPNMYKYVEESENIFEIAKNYSDKYESMGLDECYLDMTNTLHLFNNGDIVKTAIELQKKILEKTRLTCSVGVGYNKLSAKLASNRNKPLGFHRYHSPKDFVKDIIDKKVSIIWGIGKNVEKKLNEHRIFTVRHIHEHSLFQMQNLFGVYGEFIYNAAHGIDTRMVAPSIKDVGIGNSKTQHKDLYGIDQILKAMLPVIQQACFRLQKRGKYSKTITVKLRYSDFKLKTRAKTLDKPVHTIYEIYNIAKEILLTKYDSLNNVRLVGIRLSSLSDIRIRKFRITDNIKQIKKLGILESLKLDLRTKYGYDVITDTCGF